MIGFFRKGERAVQLRTGLLKSHESVSSLFWPMRRGRDPCSVSIIGFGNVGLFIAYRYLKEGYSVCVYDSDSDVTRVQQIMQAELPQMLNSFKFGKHLVTPELLQATAAGHCEQWERALSRENETCMPFSWVSHSVGFLNLQSRFRTNFGAKFHFYSQPSFN